MTQITTDRLISDAAQMIGDEVGTTHRTFALHLKGLMLDLGLHFYPIVKSIQPCIDANYAVIMPDDTLDLVGVHAISENGVLLQLGKVKGQHLEVDNCEGETTYRKVFRCIISDDSIFGEAYSTTNASDYFRAGVYQWDKAENRINFSEGSLTSIGSKVSIVYETKQSISETRPIPNELYNVAINRIIELYYRGVSPQRSAMYHKYYISAVRDYERGLSRGVSIQDIVATMFGSKPGNR